MDGTRTLKVEELGKSSGEGCLGAGVIHDQTVITSTQDEDD
jgi:hypothetical protein